VPDNVRRGRPQGKCHREQTAAPPHFPSPRKRGRVGRGAAVRVKRCGKSAPRLRQRKRHGKPHREQNRIGTAWGPTSRKRRRRPRIDVRILPSGWVARNAGQPAFQRNGRHAAGSRLPPHKTRLIGRLICEGGPDAATRRAPASFGAGRVVTRARRVYAHAASVDSPRTA
jgi:hypothetical protein